MILPSRASLRFLLPIAALCLSGCQSPGGGSALSSEALQGRWQVVSIDGRSVAPQSRAFIEFSEPPRLTGNGGCNRFFGMYRYVDSTLAIEPEVGSTKMACEATVMAQEQQLFQWLPEATRAEWVDGQLRLLDSSGKTLLRADRLDGKDAPL